MEMKWNVTLTRKRRVEEVASIIVAAATMKEAEEAALAIAETASNCGPELDWEPSGDFDDGWKVEVDFCDGNEDGEEEAEDRSDE
jgi:hypothetical protein